jgi:hypothetical protein
MLYILKEEQEVASSAAALVEEALFSIRTGRKF